MLHSISPSRGLRSAIALVAFAAAAMASAASESYSFNLVPDDPSVDMMGTLYRSNWYGALSTATNPIGKFDASKGTLNSVKITFDWSGYFDGAITNMSTSQGELDLWLQHSLKLGLNPIGGGTNYGSSTLIDFSDYADLSGPSIKLDKNETYSYSTVGANGLPAILSGKTTFTFNSMDSFFASEFIGSDNLNLEASVLGDAWATINAPMRSDVNTFASINGKIEFNYTAPASAVPAPPAFAAMGLGALRLARRRRNRA